MKKRSVTWLFLCCWLTYLTAYLCRVNFSSALHTLTIEKGFTAAELGVVGAVFYAIYACGQLINFDEETLEAGSIICDECGETLEFSFEDEDEDEE